MAQQLYQVIFTGDIADGWDVSTVTHNLAKLFKADPTLIMTLFSGRPVVIKQGIDRETAMKYTSAISRAGGVSRAEPMAAGETRAAQRSDDRRDGERRAVPSRRARERLSAIQPDRRRNPDRRRSSKDQ